MESQMKVKLTVLTRQLEAKEKHILAQKRAIEKLNAHRIVSEKVTFQKF